MMTTYTKEREDFLLRMQSEGMPAEIARRILRHANTVQRLAVLACNGDRRPYVECPGVSGARGTRCLCDLPGGQHEKVAPVELELAHAQDLIAQWCAKASAGLFNVNTYRNGRKAPFEPVFQGDPRGACVKLKVPSRKTDDGNHEGICVPTRRY